MIRCAGTHRLRFTWEATARCRRSLTSRQHFEVDVGGIKCSLASKKIRSHFVIVSVPVKFVPDKRIMCMILQSPSRARLRRRSFSLSDEINDQTICLSQKIPKPWLPKSSAWGTVPPHPPREGKISTKPKEQKKLSTIVPTRGKGPGRDLVLLLIFCCIV